MGKIGRVSKACFRKHALIHGKLKKHVSPNMPFYMVKCDLKGYFFFGFSVGDPPPLAAKVRHRRSLFCSSFFFRPFRPGLGRLLKKKGRMGGMGMRRRERRERRRAEPSQAKLLKKRWLHPPILGGTNS